MRTIETPAVNAVAPPHTALRRVLQNATLLLSGNSAAALFGALSVLVAARHLGPTSFGSLVLIQAYVLIVDRIFAFQSWQAVIKFGADLLALDDRDGFKALVRKLAALDLTTAIVATAVAFAGIGVASGVFDWGPDTRRVAGFYCFAILVHLSGVPTGVLRLFGRFQYVAAHAALLALLKLAAVVGAAVLGAGFSTFVVIWIVSDIALHVTLVALALVSLRQRGFAAFSSAPRRQTPGLWRFVWTTNVYSSIRLATREADILIIGAGLGSGAVGIYKIAKQIGSMILKVTDPMYISLYPELAKQRSSNDGPGFVRLMTRIGAIAGSIGVIGYAGFALLAQPFVERILGSGYVDAVAVLRIYAIALVIAMATLPLQPAMLAMGRPETSLKVLVLATAAYLVSLPVLMRSIGLPGAAAAYVLFYLVWGTLMLVLTIHHVHQWQRAAERAA